MSTLHAPLGNGLKPLGLQGRFTMLFTVFALIGSFIMAAVGYRMMVSSSRLHLRHSSDNLASIVDSTFTQPIRLTVCPQVSTIAKSPLLQCNTLEERLSFLPVLTTLLANYPLLGGFHFSLENGIFFGVRRISSNTERLSLGAPPNGEYVVESCTQAGGREIGEYLFYTANLVQLAREPFNRSSRFPHARHPWHRQAAVADTQIKTVPMLLHDSREPVMIFAEKSPDGKAVSGADVLLNNISDLLRRKLPTPESHISLIRHDGTLLADADGMLRLDDEEGETLRTLNDLAPISREAARAYAEGRRGQELVMWDGERPWEVSIHEFEAPLTSEKIAMLLAVPRDDMRAGGRKFLLYAAVGTAAFLIVCLPMVRSTTGGISTPLRSLVKSSDNLQDFVQGEAGMVNSEVPEIRALAENIDGLQKSVRNILSVIRTISSEQDFNFILQTVLRGIVSLSKADGGFVGLLEHEDDSRIREGGIYWNLDNEEIVVSLPPGYALDESLRTIYSLKKDSLVRSSVSEDDPRASLPWLAPGFAHPDVKSLDMVSVPLRGRFGEVLGALVLFRRVKADDVHFRESELSFIEDFAGVVSIALESQHLLKAQTDLRDSLIHIIAGAIDAKSPYTGSHCRQVPVIFEMLLNAACKAKDGPFADFHLDEDGREEARLAAWLHDCGKVTTPEYVVDKATKLETIYDRIHEIRTRFEVLKRDAEIASLRDVLGGAEPQAARRRLEKELRALDDDFVFVAACNSGESPMTPEALERLASIAKRPWVRTLDKRLGVSRGERARMEKADTADVPVSESLLMDNPEHIIPRGEKDMPPGCSLEGTGPNGLTPLYDRGELYNLSIRRGTLTAEERCKINEHITLTIAMLEAMPLPKHLRNMPEIAGAHHETMDGQGYPKGLTREQMSPQARMMAIADIFEALTAWDRPYKAGKGLKEALRVMDTLRDKRHIDAELYELFLKADIPRRYGKLYLKREQRDLEG